MKNWEIMKKSRKFEETIQGNYNIWGEKYTLNISMSCKKNKQCINLFYFNYS